MAKSSVVKIIVCAAVAGIAIVGASIGMGIGIKKTSRIGIVSNIEQAQFQGEGTYKVGDIVTLEAEEVEGYRFVYWQFNNKRVSTENPYTFKLNKKNGGKYSAVYEKLYSLNKANTTNGEIALSVETAITGERVNVTVTPSENYELDELYYIEEEGTEHIDIEENVFNMPSKNVTVYATFKQIEYTIEKGELSNGYVEFSAVKATLNTEITLTVTPATGYKTQRVYYVNKDNEEIDVVYNEGYKFNMPSGNVTVYATFVLDE